MTVEDYAQVCLDRAQKRGAYRSELVRDAPINLTTQQIKQAIAIAKSRGMYSVPDMRRIDGDTWYQYDGLETEGKEE